MQKRWSQEIFWNVYPSPTVVDAVICYQDSPQNQDIRFPSYQECWVLMDWPQRPLLWDSSQPKGASTPMARPPPQRQVPSNDWSLSYSGTTLKDSPSFRALCGTSWGLWWHCIIAQLLPCPVWLPSLSTGLVPHTNLHFSEFSRKPEIRHLPIPLQKTATLLLERQSHDSCPALGHHWHNNIMTPSLSFRHALWPARSPHPEPKSNTIASQCSSIVEVGCSG